MLRRRLLTFYFVIRAFPYNNTVSFQEEWEIRPKVSIAAFSGLKHRSSRRPLNSFKYEYQNASLYRRKENIAL